VFDPQSSDGEFSYSPAFWVLDQNGNRSSDLKKEPKFPRAAAPRTCFDGTNCAESVAADDPRDKLSSAALLQMLALQSALPLACTAILFMMTF
jgi:hypothetical protein